MRYFDARLDTRKDRRFIAECFRRLKAQQQLCTALCTWILRQEQDARLRSFGSGTVSEPGRQWNTRREFRCQAAHVEYDRAKAATL
jgi:hypothetical protein